MSAERVAQVSPPVAVAEVAIEAEYGWRHHPAARGSIWCKGHGVDASALLDRLVRGGPPGAREVTDAIETCTGNWAFVATGPGWAVVAVDRVRSTPVAWARSGQGWLIDDQAGRLAQRLGLSAADTHRDAALAVAMAGYTIDVDTIYRPINQLGPGEYVRFGPGDSAERVRYHAYRPWLAPVAAIDMGRLRERLAELTLDVIWRTIDSLGDRTLMVPLSAGRDSRLIVSAARHLGFRNIKTFSYGRTPNHEARAAESIAERLGYPWRFVQITPEDARAFFRSHDYAAYRRFADTAQSVPFVQDMAPLQRLKQDGYLDVDAVLCNGNTGDFISGGHIPPSLMERGGEPDPKARLARILDAVSEKHFSLWEALRTPPHLARIAEMLETALVRAGAEPGDQSNDFGLAERLEFQDRQCKYVIGGQRIYEFLGHEWRLPLWDDAYLDFWQQVPLECKRGQALYRDTLDTENWGGVWSDVPINAKIIRPRWLIPLRWIAKAAFTPVGRRAWHRFERRYFGYFMHTMPNMAWLPYRRIAADRRGARHGVSWLTERYLADHGLDWTGSPADA